LALLLSPLLCHHLKVIWQWWAVQDAWRGTKLLGTDVGVAMVLLRRAVLGQKLTDREEKILRRTLMDLASVIPIGFLMLLPVSPRLVLFHPSIPLWLSTALLVLCNL